MTLAASVEDGVIIVRRQKNAGEGRMQEALAGARMGTLDTGRIAVYPTS
jgi:hypothetical protein